MRTIFVFAIIVLCLASIAMSVKPDGNHSPSSEFSPSNNSNPFNIVNDAEKMSVLPAFEAIVYGVHAKVSTTLQWNASHPNFIDADKGVKSSLFIFGGIEMIDDVIYVSMAEKSWPIETLSRAFLSFCSTSSSAVARCEALQGISCGLL
jgi:hypothetical protein